MVNEIIYTLGPCCCSYHYTVYRHNIVGLKLILLLNIVLDISAISVMGGRKFRLSKHRKNEERKKGRTFVTLSFEFVCIFQPKHWHTRSHGLSPTDLRPSQEVQRHSLLLNQH